ncbi:MAG: COX15/CtaA family protein [Gammaproteobacteria bacterium]|nr:COX15/CtaA family protein [Gammaproteobacteria bacterium]
MQPFKGQYRLAIFTCLLAFSVILMGAYVRLSDAGLGCPDWPGCYGRLIAPSEQSAIGESYADRPLDTGKAWKEMIHRYLAGSLGLAILLLAILAWRNRKQADQPLWLPSVLLVLVIFQAVLGMWTVTLLVKPAIVTAHLLGGLATLALLGTLILQLRPDLHGIRLTGHNRRLVIAALLTLILQIFLGGWTSTNYAALGCSEFPTCYGGEWWPVMDFHEAFVIWRGLGVNYEFGILEPEARTAIHMAHRLGALLTLLVVGLLSLRLIRQGDSKITRNLGLLIFGLLGLQITLGITNVLGHLPLPVAVAHNGGAALLLLTLVATLWATSPNRKTS